MTLTVITTTSTRGLVLSGNQNPLTVTSTGAVDATNTWAIFGPGGTNWSVWNFGILTAAGTAVSSAVYLSGGSFSNGGISGTNTNFSALVSSSGIGVEMGGAGSKAKNYGTVTAASVGVDLVQGGLVVNGATAGQPAGMPALIQGGSFGVEVLGGGGTVQNLGTISATSGVGVYLTAGTVTNGSATLGNTSALISGGRGTAVEIKGAGGVVANYGTILGSVLLDAGGTIMNGSTSNSSALFSSNGIGIQADGTVQLANFGRISASVLLGAGGTVVNGSTAAKSADIKALSASSGGLVITNVGTIGTITASGPVGNDIRNEGESALIKSISLLSGSVLNFGTISGTSQSVIAGGSGTVIVSNHNSISALESIQKVKYQFPESGQYAYYAYYSKNTAISLSGGGSVINGDANDTHARVSGVYGIRISGLPGIVANFGTVIAGAILTHSYYLGKYHVKYPVSNFAAAISLSAGGVVTNGSSVDTNAYIAGNCGIAISGGTAQVVNFGTINAYCPISISQAGTVANYGLLEGFITLYSGNVSNSGNILGSVSIVKTGSFTNSGNVSRGFYGADLNNTGTIGYSVHAYGSGTVTNGATTGSAATIGGSISESSIGSRVVNFGSIGGSVTIGGSGFVSNFGLIEGGIDIVGSGTTIDNYGIIRNGFDASGGTVRNGSAAITSATIFGTVGIAQGALTNVGTLGGAVIGSSGTLLNGAPNSRFGTILGGVTASGTLAAVTNFGTIAGNVGVYMANGAGPLTNAGLITGTNGLAVDFAGGNAHLILDAGAAFSGIVSAGGTAASNLLELAAATGAGSIAGVGTSITNFGSIVIDAGAHWSLAGSDSLATGTTLSLASGATLAIAGTVTTGKTVSMLGSGVLTVASTGNLQFGTGGKGKSGQINVDRGHTLNAVGTLAGAVADIGRIDAGTGTLTLAGGVSGSGTIGIDAGSVLNAKGALGVASVAFLAGGKESVILGAPKRTGTVFTGFGKSAGNTIDLAGIVGARVHFAHGVLAVIERGGGLVTLKLPGNYHSSQFAIGTDHHGGSNITFV